MMSSIPQRISSMMQSSKQKIQLMLQIAVPNQGILVDPPLVVRQQYPVDSPRLRKRRKDDKA